MNFKHLDVDLVWQLGLGFWPALTQNPKFMAF